MERLKIDASLLEKLKSLTSSVELVNDEGFVVAEVVPMLDPKEYDGVRPDFYQQEDERKG